MRGLPESSNEFGSEGGSEGERERERRRSVHIVTDRNPVQTQQGASLT